MLRKLVVGMGVLILALWAAPALGGGWAVITLDSLPGEVRAGEEIEIGFMMRGHGRTPVDGGSPSLLANNPETGEQLQVHAVQSEKPGHYTASVTFPEAGVWEWEILADPYPQTLQLAPLTVLPATAAAPTTVTTPYLVTILRFILRLVSLALLALAGFIFLRQRQAGGDRAIPSAGD
ncbi:MAG TPA: FixH family protein [Candidatus Sulfomarinibacteraceae bacterium]|nr:FixH family protein [Candidatus Sulfomarinibacteraceae bacterium]